MTQFVKLKRLKEIGMVLARYGLAGFLPSPILNIFGLKGPVSGEKTFKELSVGEKLRLAFEELGATYIKLGQLLSLRQDIIPDDVAREFKKLQDQVSPLSWEIMRPIIETELAYPINDIFLEFNETPIAAASISQVYEAVLAENGASVVLKVRKPGIVNQIKGDMDILFWFADLMQKHSSMAKQFDFKGIVEEFFLSMNDELDLLIEMTNTTKFRDNFSAEQWSWATFPFMYENHCTNSLLVMEKIENGKKLYEIEDGFCDRKAVAENGARLLLKQIFEDGFFHADLHAGNFFLLGGDKMAIIDCGMAASLDRYTREMIAEMFIAFSKRDYITLANIYVEMSDSPSDLNKKQLAKDLRKLLESLPDKLGEVDVSEIFQKTFVILRKHKLKIPRSLTMLIRGISLLDGIGRELDPEFDIIEHSQTFADVIIKMKYSPDRIAENAYHLFMRLVDAARTVPVDISDILQRIESGNLNHKMELRFSRGNRVFLSKLVTRISSAFVLTGFVISFRFYRDAVPLNYISYAIITIVLGLFLLTFRKGKDDK